MYDDGHRAHCAPLMLAKLVHVAFSVSRGTISSQRTAELQFFETGVERHFHHTQAIYAPTKADPTAQSQHLPAPSVAKVAPALHSKSFVEEGRTVHTLCTSNGSPYINFQSRIMYGTYKLAQKMPGGEKMVAFTRILHRTLPDELMQVWAICCKNRSDVGPVRVYAVQASEFHVNMPTVAPVSDTTNNTIQARPLTRHGQ